MPENQDVGNGAQTPNAIDPQVFARWVQQAQAKLKAGGTLGPNELPTGYKVEGNQLVQDTNIRGLIRDLVLTAIAGFGGAAAFSAFTGTAAGGAAAAGAGAGAADVLPSTAINAGLFTAPTVTSSGAVDAALAGAAGGAAGAGATTGVLPSTQIGTGMMPPAGAAPGTSGVLPSTAIGNGAAAPAGSAATPAGLPSSASQMSAASPGTADGLPDWLKTAKDLGDSLGADAAGRAQGRNADNLANIGFAQAQNDLYNSELKAPQQIASNAVRGDILSNAKDVSMSAPSDIPVPTISGGLRPSMFSDTTRQLGKNITANAAATLMPTPTPPVLQPMETAGTTDDILNTAGYLSNLVKPATDIWKMFNHA